MRSIVIHAAKDLRVEARDERDPGPGEVAIDIAMGGICGSDLHYYLHGGFGPVRLKEPMILGHEVSGHVSALGQGVSGVGVGDLVAVNPSRPCRTCRFCLDGAPNHCLDMRFYGSAMPFPHIQGAFQQRLVADAVQCVPVPANVSPGAAAMAEPLSVCLHAVRRAGSLVGRRVLVTGCGPIGVLCILSARRAGAHEIVATDLTDQTLAYAKAAGADRTINMATEADGLGAYEADKGTFDVLLEASGAAPALVGAFAALRPRARVVQLGLGGDMTLPMNMVVAKELELCGSFRFHEEFQVAVDMIASGLIDVAPLITHTFPLAEAEQAFETAADRSRAMKAQIAFA